MIVKLDENNFEEKTAKGLKLVEFYAPWCGYCAKQEPILEEMHDLWIGQVNGDASLKLTEKFAVTGFPTFIILKDGKELTRFSGLHSKFDIMNILSEYMKN